MENKINNEKQVIYREDAEYECEIIPGTVLSKNHKDDSEFNIFKQENKFATIEASNANSTDSSDEEYIKIINENLEELSTLKLCKDKFYYVREKSIRNSEIFSEIKKESANKNIKNVNSEKCLKSHDLNTEKHLFTTDKKPLSKKNIENQSVSVITLTSKNNDIKCMNESSNNCNKLLKNDELSNPFLSPSLSVNMIRRKRESSKIAEVKYLKILKKQVEPEESSLKEKNSLFCDSIKTNLSKSLDGFKNRDKNEYSILMNKDFTDIQHDSPIHKQFLPHKILIDKTNSPTTKILKNDYGVSPLQKNYKINSGTENTSSKFFLQNLDFLKKRKKSKRKDKNKDYKKYLKAKKSNTYHNQGYKTVTPKRKAVIDLYSGPNTFYSNRKKNRMVYFDMESRISIHNNLNEFKSIVIENTKEVSFKWDKDKEVVNIVKRVDLGSDYTIDDFVFTKVNSKIEL